MQDVRVTLRRLTEEAKVLHVNEREITLASVMLVGQLDRANAAANLGMTDQNYAEYIGLTVHQYRRRAHAARILRRFPKTVEMVRAGETHLSTVAVLHAKITEVNQDLVLAGIKGKSKREAEFFLSTVTFSGEIREAEPEIDLRLRLTKSQVARLDRAREVLSHSGRVPDLAEIVVKALEDLLHRRDPQQLAERALVRKEKADAAASGQRTRTTPTSDGVAPVQPDDHRVSARSSMPAAPGQRRKGRARPAVPKAIEHAMRLRDQGQCTWMHPDGTRCPERGMLEMDHIKTMWCRGGKHSVDDMGLRCRRHNQLAAERELGPGYMVNWEESRARAEQAAMTAQ